MTRRRSFQGDTREARETRSLAENLAECSDDEVMVFYDTYRTLSVVWRDLVKRGLATKIGEGIHTRYELNEKGNALVDE